MSAWDIAKPLVSEAIDQDPHPPPRGFHLFYPAALPLSSQGLHYTAGIIRRQVCSPWRRLNPGRQALLVLAYLRKGDTLAELAAGFGNRHHYRLALHHETVALLATRCPARYTT